MAQLDDGQEANRHADLDEMEGGEDGDAEVGTAKKRGRGSLGGEGRGWDDEVDEDMPDGPVDQIEEEEEVPPKPIARVALTVTGSVSDFMSLLKLKPHELPQAPRRLQRTQVKPADPVPMIKVGDLSCRVPTGHPVAAGGQPSSWTSICALHACMRLLEHLLRRVAQRCPTRLKHQVRLPTLLSVHWPDENVKSFMDLANSKAHLSSQ
ncbi:unnamed protein product [Vitrella brassicaformis CCMP3155]|uniref:Uncharacterized protein n=1 Tax=Vitrella brassicaformis (strain CCMP3155) TaxID=1169540 RepID=A0A0G4G487_VITBC|nr:unnamed protein product [Vitrella brassicaformis CCMP3155]|eukprot:CEM23130.1 unnamed protein product [Vitrella brassicaformis CCMP3155]